MKKLLLISMKILSKTFIAGLIALSMSMSSNAEKVNIGDPGWTGATTIANLLSAVITDKMGGEVELVPGNNTAIYGAIDRSKGEIEVHPDIWLPNQQAYTNDLVPKGTLKLSPLSYEGNQGYCVSQDFASEMNITSIFDLGRPEVVAAMDSDGNGKGEFWIGADGWASANVNEVKVRDYQLLDAGIEPIRAAEAVKNARVLDSIKKGEGYAFYCYKPHAIWGMADVVMLTEPTHDPDKYKMIQPKTDADWYKKSYVASKDALKNIQIGWGTSLEAKSPAIVKFFNNFQLTSDDVSWLAYEVSVNKRDPAEVARDWMSQNKGTVDGWLGQQPFTTEEPTPNVAMEEPVPSKKDEVFSAASGSGFAVTSDGYVVTNYHVIEGCTDVKIHDKGKSILATLVTFDPNNDIALLKGDFKPRSFYPLSKEGPKILMDIYVAGHPFGDKVSNSVKVTKGIVSSLSGLKNDFSRIQIDAAIQPGNSGGPIMNDRGNVIGVAVSKLDMQQVFDDYGVVPENVNFGVKANVVINILESENIKFPSPNEDVISAKKLGEMITDGTYYLSCWMTLAQIEQMLETKVMFKDLK